MWIKLGIWFILCIFINLIYFGGWMVFFKCCYRFGIVIFWWKWIFVRIINLWIFFILFVNWIIMMVIKIFWGLFFKWFLFGIFMILYSFYLWWWIWIILWRYWSCRSKVILGCIGLLGRWRWMLRWKWWFVSVLFFCFSNDLLYLCFVVKIKYNLIFINII